MELHDVGLWLEVLLCSGSATALWHSVRVVALVAGSMDRGLLRCRDHTYMGKKIETGRNSQI